MSRASQSLPGDLESFTVWLGFYASQASLEFSSVSPVMSVAYAPDKDETLIKQPGLAGPGFVTDSV